MILARWYNGEMRVPGVERTAWAWQVSEMFKYDRLEIWDELFDLLCRRTTGLTSKGEMCILQSAREPLEVDDL